MERCFRGEAVSGGIAIGKAYHYCPVEYTVESAQAGNPAEERKRLETARAKALEELKTIQNSFPEEQKDKAMIFAAHQELLEDETPGNLEHPLWGIRYCYFTGLELTQEPKENVVDYKFTFTQALTNGIVPK